MDKLNSLTELQILSLAKEGDSEAQNFIINEYRKYVELISLKYGSSPIENDDLIQEGMIGLLAAINSFDESKEASFKTFASTCIQNSIQTALRKTNRKKDVPTGNVVSLEEDSIGDFSSALSAEDSFLAKESVSNLTNQLNSNLSRFENNVLRLHMAGCSYSEIAKKFDKNEKAIDNALQRIRKKLKEVSF